MTTHFDLRLEAPPGAETPADLLASPSFTSLLSRASFLGYKVVAVNATLHLPLPSRAPATPFVHPLREPLPVLQSAPVRVAAVPPASPPRAPGAPRRASESCAAAPPPPSAPQSSLDTPLVAWLPSSLSPFHALAPDAPPRRLGANEPAASDRSRAAPAPPLESSSRPSGASPPLSDPAAPASPPLSDPAAPASPPLAGAGRLPPHLLPAAAFAASVASAASASAPKAAPRSPHSPDAPPLSSALLVPRVSEVSASLATVWGDLLPYGAAAARAAQTRAAAELRALDAGHGKACGEQIGKNSEKNPEAGERDALSLAASGSQPRGLQQCLVSPADPIRSCDLMQLRRVTVVLHTVSSAASLSTLFPPNPPFYASGEGAAARGPSCIDIVAVQPTDDATWQFACSSCECDLISIDFSGAAGSPPENDVKKGKQSALLAATLREEDAELEVAGASDARGSLVPDLQRLPFTIRRRHVQQALRRGLCFEISLAAFLPPRDTSAASAAFASSPAFLAVLSNVQRLLRFVPPSRLLLSSGARTPEQLHPPALAAALFAGLRIGADGDEAVKVASVSAAAVLARGAAKQAAGGACVGGWIGAGM